MVRRALLGLLWLGCSARGAVGPGPSAGPALLHESAPTPPSVEPKRGFAAFAEHVYEALAAGDRQRVQALLAEREEGRAAYFADKARAAADPNELDLICVQEPQRTTTEAGSWLYGGRTMLRVDAHDRIVEVVTLDACVASLEAGLLTLTNHDYLYYVLPDGTELSLHRGPLDAPSVHDRHSRSWAVLLREDGAYLALRRRDGRITRGAGHDPESDQNGSESGPWVSGAWMVRQDTKGEIHAEHTDAGEILVQGCPGQMTSALETSTGLAIHVRPAIRDDAPASPITRLCLVDPRGKTRRVVDLGHAVCGLAGPVPCAWELSLAQGDLIALTSMRGQRKFVDAASGRTLAHAVSSNEGNEVGCGRDVCIDRWNEHGDVVRERLRPNLRTGRMVRISTETVPPEPSTGWCNHEGLLVPEEYCETPDSTASQVPPPEK